MPTATMSKDLSIYQDANDPTEPGDIKVVGGAKLEIDDCDSIAAWSVHSGAGVTIELESGRVYEGTGSVKVTIPGSTTAIVKVTGTWDFYGSANDYKYLKASMFNWTSNPVANCNIHFGESTYNEQNMGVFTLDHTIWTQKIWNISAIAEASKDGVTIVAFTIPNTITFSQIFYIDYVFADPGPSQVKAFDGDKVILLYPKVYSSSYTGNGTSQTITIPRKGTPSRIQIDRMTKRTCLWINGMTSGHSKTMAQDTADGSAVIDDITTGITAVGDCNFSLGASAQVNENGETYFYTAWWDD